MTLLADYLHDSVIDAIMLLVFVTYIDGEEAVDSEVILLFQILQEEIIGQVLPGRFKLCWHSKYNFFHLPHTSPSSTD